MEKTLGKSIDNLFKMRTARNALQHQVDDMTEKMEAVKAEIIAGMQRENIDKASGKMATAFLETMIHPSISDKDVFLKWIFKNKRFEFLANKVNSAPVKEMLENKNKVPPGVSVFSQPALNLRKI